MEPPTLRALLRSARWAQIAVGVLLGILLYDTLRTFSPSPPYLLFRGALFLLLLVLLALAIQNQYRFGIVPDYSYLCRYCHGPVNRYSEFCEHCGADLVAEEKTVSCSSCGSTFLEGTKFCSECGKRLPATPR